ncbi:hypothetical protein [Blastococcus sp. SYSU DS0619]
MTTSPNVARRLRWRRSTSALAVLGTGLALVATGSPALAAPATSTLTDETFAGATTGSADWFLPSPGSNRACLTAGTSTAQQPIRACSATAIDAAGSGTLRLTSNLNEQVGNAYNAVSLPTARGLDIAFDTFQYARDLTTGGGYDAGADGISFILAATDPENPAPPTTQGATGGALGYSNLGGGTPGVSYGYLGFGIDVYGNFTNGDFGGTDCGEARQRNTAPQNVGVRGPGSGTRGYCLLEHANLVNGDLDKPGQTTRPTAVPVRVAINPSDEPMVTGGGLTVPARSFALSVTTYVSGVRTLTGPLPTIDPGLGFPADWINPATGLPYQLSFGWGASTGGSNEIHEVGGLRTATLSGQLPAFTADVAGGPIAAGGQGTVQVTPEVAATGGPEAERTTVTTTFPAALVPQAGSFTTAEGYACTTAAAVTTCRYTPGSPIAAGGSLPVLRIPVTSADGTTPGSYAVTTKVSSIDARPATARGSVSVTPPPPGAPTALTAVPDASAVRVAWQPPTGGEPAARYRVTSSPGAATCSTTGTSCVLGGVAGVGYTITVVPISADGVEGTPATVTTRGGVAAPVVPATPPADAELTLTTTDGDITEAEAGQEITVIGTGFLAHSTVTIVIHSTPIVLGTVTTDATGSFRKAVTVPLTLEAGTHSLVAYGVDPQGDPHALRLDVVVEAAAAPAAGAPSGGDGALAYTGTSIDPFQVSLIGAGLVLAGALALVGVRRRRRPAGT